ncbi:MAG TPA: divergent polysaccharide deacetylase family protein [Deltaproteobacteria bacterium]|nr:divergent polysaccharide deacetylase family protein [Deltaproteobacteria bacterium]
MPPGKRTETWKARGGRKKDRPKGGPPAPPKRPPTPLLLAWVVAVIFLTSLIYFAAQSQRLPDPTTADLSTLKTAKNSQVRTAPSGAKVEPASPKREEGSDLPTVAERSEEKTERSSFGSDNSTQLPLRSALPPLAYTPKVLPAPRPAVEASPDVSPKQAKVSIVIDDFGTDLGIAKQFASLPFPVTLSVLPHLAHSREIAELAHMEGREVILHLPMEPLNSSESPGPGALLLSMSGDQIRRNIKAALDTSPYFDGVNNHMGSRMTRDAHIMETVLSELKGRGLFFIDSMTTNESKGWKVARELKIPTLKRDIFLDDDPSAEAIRSQIARLVKIAKIRGMALAIGHPHKTTLRSLQEEAAHFGEKGIEIVAVRDLINK